MHVGLCTGFSNYMKLPDARFLQEELKQILLGEELGYDSIWMTEHHFDDYSVSPAPLMTLAWVAANTKHMRLGTAVIVAPWHDPVRLAEQLSWLDHLSGGRLVVGLGRGLARLEYEGLRIDQSKARELFDEIVALVLNALETGFIEGGEIFQQPRREIRPRPLRSLKGRAFVAGGTPDSLRATAKLGLPRLFLNQPMTTSTNPPALRRRQDPGRPRSGPGGPARRSLADGMAGAPSERAAAGPVRLQPRLRRREPRPAPSTWRAPMPPTPSARRSSITRCPRSITARSRATRPTRRLRLKPEDIEGAVEGVVQQSIYGTPKDVLKRFEEVKSLRKPQGFFPHLWTGGMPHQEVVRNLTYFAKHCLPELKSWTGEPSTIGWPRRHDMSANPFNPALFRPRRSRDETRAFNQGLAAQMKGRPKPWGDAGDGAGRAACSQHPSRRAQRRSSRSGGAARPSSCMSSRPTIPRATTCTSHGGGLIMARRPTRTRCSSAS